MVGSFRLEYLHNQANQKVQFKIMVNFLWIHSWSKLFISRCASFTGSVIFLSGYLTTLPGRISRAYLNYLAQKGFLNIIHQKFQSYWESRPLWKPIHKTERCWKPEVVNSALFNNPVTVLFISILFQGSWRIWFHLKKFLCLCYFGIWQLITRYTSRSSFIWCKCAALNRNEAVWVVTQQ